MTQRRIHSRVTYRIATIAACATLLSISGCRKQESPPGSGAQSQGAAPPPAATGSSENSPAAPAVGTSSSDTSGYVPPPSAPTTPAAIAAVYASRPAALSTLTLAEFQYGASPTRNRDVTYQPDVVVMEHGADAIHGYSSDGLTWLLDANAPHVSELQTGKVMFATGRAVGRILAITPHGSDVAVTLGPVALNEIASDLDMAFEQPVDLSSAITYTAPNWPLTADMEPLAKDSTKTSDARVESGHEVVLDRVPATGWAVPVSFVSRPASAPVPSYWREPRAEYDQGGVAGQVFNLIGPTIGVPGVVSVSGFKVEPYVGGGMGIKIVNNSSDFKMLASGGVRLDRPSVRVKVQIKGGTIQTAELELKGVAALLADIQAGTPVGLSGNINKFYYVPTDLSIPIVGKALPIAVTLRQSFEVRTAFTAKNSTLNGGGEEDFTGSVLMGLHSGSWGVSAPTAMTNKRDLLQSINGVSLGPSALIFGWGTKIIVGVGAFGFATGPYIGYNTQFALVRGSDLTSGLVPVPPCHGAQLMVSLNVGVGYAIPDAVVKTVNAILHLLQLNTTLEPTGGVQHHEVVIDKKKSVPDKCASF